MTGLSLVSADLTAAAVDVEARTAEGILVPWGEPGRTNLGAGVKVLRGAVRFPADGEVIGIVGHDRERPVSKLIAHEDRDEGLWGRLKIAATPAGDQLLAEIREGIRARLSVEMADLEFDADGHIASGLMDFVAHVPRGAFDSARVHQLAAAVHHPTPTDGDSVTELAPAPEPTMTPSAPAPVTVNYTATGVTEDTAQQLLAALQASRAPAYAAAPGGLTYAAAPPAPSGEPVDVVRRAAELQAAVFRGESGRELKAALADITNTGLDLFQQPSGAIGEKLWEGAAYTRQFVGLMRSKPLTSWEYKSWQWVNRPKVAAYAGDKAEIPTNTVSVEQFTNEATRVAGGWDIDRKFRDFGDAEFWAEFWVAGAESYREVTDLQAAAAIVAAARDITVDANVPASYTALNTAPTNDAEGLLKAVALGTAIMEDTPRVRKAPDYIIVNPAQWLSLVNLTALDLPAFLALLKVRPENFLRSSEVPAGSVILGVQPAMTFRELPGAAPIRVEALDVAHGGIDAALFGYTGISHDRPGGVIEVPLAV